jgi:hypothetical protein
MPAHKCPSPSCDAQVSQAQFACRKHWYELPKDLRERIWAAYRNSQWDKHREALLEATNFLNATEATA